MTMELDVRTVKPGNNGTLTGEKGEILVPPAGWAFLPAGDAGITRKVTSKSSYWRVEIKKGRRTISLGIWAPENAISAAKDEVSAVRSTETYRKKRASDAVRREKKQELYSEEFIHAIRDFLSFHSRHIDLEEKLAGIIADHAVPVGSGTVARTQMIPIEKRAQLAVIAWMRHQTTAYDNLKIARIKGERREVRRTLAKKSLELLENYRSGKDIPENCPLFAAVNRL